MIDKMTRYDFILLSGDKDSFLESLSSLGVMDITRSSKPVDGKSSAMLSRIEDIAAEISRIEKGTDSHLKALEAERDALEKEAGAAERWGDYDRSKLEALGLPVRFYCIPEKKFDQSWPEQFPLQELDREKGKVWFVTLGDNTISEQPLPAPSRSRGETLAALKAKNGEIEKYLKNLKASRILSPP